MDLENRKIHTRDNVTSNSYFFGVCVEKDINCKSVGRNRKKPDTP